MQFTIPVRVWVLLVYYLICIVLTVFTNARNACRCTPSSYSLAIQLVNVNTSSTINKLSEQTPESQFSIHLSQ